MITEKQPPVIPPQTLSPGVGGALVYQCQRASIWFGQFFPEQEPPVWLTEMRALVAQYAGCRGS